MPNKLLTKFTACLSCLSVSLVLILSLVASLTITHPQTAHASTLPAYRYTKTFDTSASGAYAQGNSVATDSQGNIYVAGQFSGTVTFDGPGGSDSQTAGGGNTDAFITKYNANGSYAFTKTFDTSAGYAYGNGVATDSSGNVYVTGQFQSTVVFDGTGGSDSQTEAGSSSFLTKYNANGSYAFTKTFDTSAGNAYGFGVATDPQGNVYVTGDFSGTVVFDGTGGSDSQTSSNQSSFLTKYNPNGSYAFTKTFDTSAGGASAYGQGVATDAQGNVYVTGYFSGTVVFDGTGGSDTQTDGGGDRNTFITKYNANGSYAFTKTFDTSAAGGTFAIGDGVATDTQGNVYVTGRFTGTVVFDGVGGSDSQTAGGGTRDAFITKYNANGSYGYTKIFDNSAATWVSGAGVATDAQGNVYVTGDFTGTVVFDGTGGSDSQTASIDDTFLTRYNANGSYAYTKTFDTSASGASAFGRGVATDTQGNIYGTGYFQGTVVFDGTGGSDSQTAGGGNNDAFLTSFQVFIPGQPSSPAPSSTTATTTPVPGAPNTGFGVFMADPLRTLALYSLTSLGLAGLAMASRRLTRQQPK
jgi:hypothetical protein